MHVGPAQRQLQWKFYVGYPYTGHIQTIMLFHKILPFTRSWQDLQSFKRPFTCFEILIDHKQLLVVKYFHINHRWSLDGLWQENTQICSRLTFIKIHE